MTLVVPRIGKKKVSCSFSKKKKKNRKEKNFGRKKKLGIFQNNQNWKKKGWGYQRGDKISDFLKKLDSKKNVGVAKLYSNYKGIPFKKTFNLQKNFH